MGRKQELLLQIPAHVSDGRAGDEVLVGDNRALPPPGYSEAEAAAKFIVQVICLKSYVFLKVSLPSVMHSRYCSEMS